MAILGTNKPILLSQIKNNPGMQVTQLAKLLNTYEDLTIEDIETVVDPLIIEELKEAARDPQEKQAFDEIALKMQLIPSDPTGIQSLLTLVNRYLSKYPASPKSDNVTGYANQLSNALIEAQERERQEKERAREQARWESLNKNSYGALQGYKAQFPDSVHLSELDDLMWELTRQQINFTTINRYLSDWPAGRHSIEANNAIDQIMEWDNIRHKGDIIQIATYYQANKDGALGKEIFRKLQELKQLELEKMRKNPADYDLYKINQLFETGVFTKWELIDERLMTEESYDMLSETDREAYTNLQGLQVEDPNLSAPEGCTDIYLFGTPGTGKTCLLMGLAKANGKGYTLNMRVAGGRYASALQQYVSAGITPGRTFGNFVTLINGTVKSEIKERKLFSSTIKTVNHPINLVEMSGEEFAEHIAENDKVTFADMGTGATNLLKNNNRKVFFLIVDCSGDKIKVEKRQNIMNEQGEVIDQVVRKIYISQLDILNKFVGLFELPENRNIMKNVDSIHFVVTKSDLLADHPVERQKKAVELLREMYLGPVEALKKICKDSKRINYSTNFTPHVFTFSLGNFYLGDVFTFNDKDTLEIVNAIRAVTCGSKEKSFLDILKDKLG